MRAIMLSLLLLSVALSGCTNQVEVIVDANVSESRTINVQVNDESGTKFNSDILVEDGRKKLVSFPAEGTVEVIVTTEDNREIRGSGNGGSDVFIIKVADDSTSVSVQG